MEVKYPGPGELNYPLADKWTLLHGGYGVGMGVANIPWYGAFTAALVWEVLEPELKEAGMFGPAATYDRLINQVGDIGTVMLGWYGGNRIKGWLDTMDDKGSATAVAGIAALSVMAVGAWWILQSRAENGGNGVCTPGTIQQMQCPDGSVIIVQQCQDGQWVPTGITCPNGNGPPPACVTGEVQTQVCLDGSVITTKQCQNGQWVDTGVQCAQKEIALVGRVVDAIGMTKIIGANIRLTGRTYGAVYIAHSNYNGQYFIGNIQSDHYDVEIKAEGYIATKWFNVDFTEPHPWLDYYDFTDAWNALTLRMPVLIDLQYPNIVDFEGGHACCGMPSWLKPKSRHTTITVTATVYDNDSPSQPMPGISVIFHPNSTDEGCFFCSTADKKGYGNLSVLADHNGQAICYYYCKNEKDMQRFFDATIGWFWSVRGGIDITPPLKASGVIVTTGAGLFADKTCYGECEKEFHGSTSVGCVP